jgi:hypothetical protein
MTGTWMRRNLFNTLVTVILAIVAFLGAYMFDTQQKNPQRYLSIREGREAICDIRAEVEKEQGLQREDIANMGKSVESMNVKMDRVLLILVTAKGREINHGEKKDR